jgi:uncharacterized protein (DUF1800 family)
MARSTSQTLAAHDGPWGPVQARHLLNRAGFGGTPGEVTAVAGLGLHASVDRLLDFPDAPAAEATPDDLPDTSPLEGLPQTQAERRAAFMRGGDEAARDAIRAQIAGGGRQFVLNVLDWWLDRMAAGPFPLQEKLTLFWHGHFVTGVQNLRFDQRLIWPQQETLRTHAAGNFRAFCKAISRDPAMIMYLNNQQNREGSPNENYARELMELFTLGIGNYTEDDIKQAARAFTGWHTDGRDFRLRRMQHDNGNKTIFGVTANFGGDEVVDLLMEHPACAPYIATELVRFFASDEPDPAVCAALGELLRENKYDLRPVLSTLLRSRYFFDESNVGAKIKSPVELFVALARQSGAPMPAPRRKLSLLRGMGQMPMMPPTVEGWPSGRAWINTSTLLARVNAAVELLKQGGVDLDEAPTPGEFADLWIARLIHRPVADVRRQEVVAAGGERLTQPTARAMLDLIVSLPEFQLH